MKADKEPFTNEYGRNLQDIDGMFDLLDNVLQKMLPKAQVKLAPVLNISNESWRRSPAKQRIFNEINNNISRRNYLHMNPDEPHQRNLFDPDGTHMDDFKSIDFWTKIFMQDYDDRAN